MQIFLVSKWLLLWFFVKNFILFYCFKVIYFFKTIFSSCCFFDIVFLALVLLFLSLFGALWFFDGFSVGKRHVCIC